ncbi:hypothetical protein N8368_02765 [Bacteroidia bacterium]|nr:hypothetical protein [Bacteroidia bacterium]MDB9882872.1 hypothetical protein [Bacteroidia bacterium]MDC1395409.1 hypothetical protein [Bacteroidia bacterium]
MKRPTYTISEIDSQFRLQLFVEDASLILESKCFNTFRECEKFLATLKVHLCFQTNFCRSKNDGGQYGFEIRTCWDDLIAQSSWFADRIEREDAMNLAFTANKTAEFIHTSVFIAPVNNDLLEVA